MPRQRSLKGELHERKAGVSVKAATDEETMTFVMVSQDNTGQRYDWGTGEFYDEYLDPAGADVTDLRTMFKDHYRSVDSAVGKIESTAVINGELEATVRFGSDEASQVVAQKYREGILTDVSIGYEILDYRVEKSTEPNGRDTVTVTSYKIRELSAVGVGFDNGAKKRSQEEHGDSTMTEQELKRLAELEAIAERNAAQTEELKSLLNKRDIEDKAAKDAELEKLRAENAEMTRQADINAVATEFGISDEIRNAALEDTTLTSDAMLRNHLKAEKEHVVGVGERNNEAELKRALEDTIALRLGVDLENPHADARMFQGATLTDMARALTGYKGYNRDTLFERAMVVADLPNLLVNSGNRYLEQEFEAAAGTYRQFVKEVDVADFRPMTDIVKGVGGRLDKLNERGELKNKYLNENAETWQIGSFGNKFDFSREMFINDDLNALTDMIGTFGEMAGVTANGLVYDLLLGRNDAASYLMGDGLAIFAAGHANSGAGALASTTLSAGRLAMRKQKSTDGVTNLNIAPSYLIVGPNLEETALKLITSPTELGQTNPAVPNVHQSTLQLIVDSEITGDEWYLGASRRTIKVGYLVGTGRRPQVKVNDTTLTKTIFEGVFDFGTMAEDYRGLYKGV